MSGNNGRARGVSSEGTKGRRDGGTKGEVPLALAIPQAAALCRADRDIAPVCLVIERAEIGHAAELWEPMQSDFAEIAMRIEADQRTAGARSVVMFGRRD